MAFDLMTVPEPLRAMLERRLETLAAQGGAPAGESGAFDVIASSLPLVWACSDFVAESCLRDRHLLSWLAAHGRLHEAATSEWLAADFAASGEPAAAAAAAAWPGRCCRSRPSARGRRIPRFRCGWQTRRNPSKVSSPAHVSRTPERRAGGAGTVHNPSVPEVIV